jgi:hypothetical protein
VVVGGLKGKEEGGTAKRQEAGTARRQEAGFRVQERQKGRKQEAGTGTPSGLTLAGTGTHTMVIPAEAGIQVLPG